MVAHSVTTTSKRVALQVVLWVTQGDTNMCQKLSGTITLDAEASDAIENMKA